MTRAFAFLPWLAGGLVIALVAWRLAGEREDPDAPIRIDLATLPADGERFAGGEAVIDERSGHRPRRDALIRFTTAPLGEPTAVVEVLRRSGPQGFVRAEALGEVVPGPRFLVLGDEQTMGAVDTASGWPALVEARLRAGGGATREAVLLNAACDDYGLLHHVLRGPELLRRYEPRALIVAIATGDDVVALADPRLPHLEAGLLPAPPRVVATADPLGLAARAQQLAPGRPALARRGLAQALWLRESAERTAELHRSVDQCLRWLKEIAPRNGLLVVLLPPATLARPDEARALVSAEAAALIDAAADRAAHEAVRDGLQRLGIAWIDLLDALRAGQGPDVYRVDGRLGTTGHTIAAQAIAARLLQFIGSS